MAMREETVVYLKIVAICALIAAVSLGAAFTAIWFNLDGLAEFFVAISIVVMPFSVVLFGMMYFGRYKARTDVYGNFYGRIRIGMQVFLLSMACLLFYMGPILIIENEFWKVWEKPDLYWLVFLGVPYGVILTVVACWLVAYTFMGRIRWNRTEMSFRGASPVTRRGIWTNLVSVDEDDLELAFSDGVKICIPSVFEGYEDLFAYAKERLENT